DRKAAPGRVDTEKGVGEVLALGRAHRTNASRTTRGGPAFVAAVAVKVTTWEPTRKGPWKSSCFGVDPIAVPRRDPPAARRATYVQSTEHVSVSGRPAFVVLPRTSFTFGVSCIPGQAAMTPRCTPNAAARTAGRDALGVPSA